MNQTLSTKYCLFSKSNKTYKLSITFWFVFWVLLRLVNNDPSYECLGKLLHTSTASQNDKNCQINNSIIKNCSILVFLNLANVNARFGKPIIFCGHLSDMENT